MLEGGRLAVDDRLRTRLPTIFAAGDVIGQLQFTHAAGRYGVVVVIYTDPEIARVGLNEQEARERGVAYESTRYELRELDRAIADGAEGGFIQALTAPGKDRILGVTIVGARLERRSQSDRRRVAARPHARLDLGLVGASV